MRLIRLFLLTLFLLALLPFSAQAQSSTPPAAVRVLLNSMTPEEKVGQLFLVSFNGADVAAGTQIHELITRYHVGGVVLSAGNDNFEAANPITGAHTLIDSLQQLEWDHSISASRSTDPSTGQVSFPVYVPLFVGVAQEGDGSPADQILSGLTPLPSEMAIGATWNTTYARQVGEVRGRELSALGFNLMIGPSLDVLEFPSAAGGDLGVRVFGGDPYWVAEMGKAYISGLHNGSDNRILVIAKHFPGVGGADRLPEEEVSTVRKSLEQLKQVELAPFFAVTGNATTPAQTVDGLLVSHIRYQGFQGNIRAATRPINFDPEALRQIMALPQFEGWYQAGGLLVSDNLGANSIKEFYTAGGGQFSARVVARDAFLAGNDLLYLGNIRSTDTPDTFTATTRILEFFAQKYREDSAFAGQVDAAVARILSAKFGLYESFIVSSVELPVPNSEELGSATDITFAVARNSASLIDPSPQEIANVLPQPPQPNEFITFITDVASVQQCSTCPTQPLLAVDALEGSALRLYGPATGNQIEEYRLASFSMQNLQALLDVPDENEFVADELTRANWIVFSITNNTGGQVELISRFFRERPDLLREKRIILFSFGAPYYFDTTTISKFTAYYALYSKQPQFVDVAVRLLFKELTPVGASPVSVPSVGYDLISVTAPDPDQIISLSLDLPPAPAPSDSAITPEPTPIPLFRIGDTIAIRTGVIRDNNGNSVPDGTVVEFSMLLTGEGGGILQQVDAVTSQGVARASFGLDKPGLLEIRAVSEPASISELLQLDVSQSGAVAVTVVVPELTQSVEPTPEPPVTETEEVDPYVSPLGFPRFPAWMIAMSILLLSAAAMYGIGSQVANSQSALRWALGMSLGGLAAYNLLAFGLLGLPSWIQNAGLGGVVIFTLAGQAMGFVGGWIWSRR